MQYNKLVRDNIPERIQRNGGTSVVHVASDEEYKEKLREKLQEEVNEYMAESSVEELADILEVVYALAALHEVTPQVLENHRATKASERGAFTKRIILESA